MLRQATIVKQSVCDAICVSCTDAVTDFVVYKNAESLTSLLDAAIVETQIEFTGGRISKSNDSISVVFESGEFWAYYNIN